MNKIAEKKHDQEKIQYLQVTCPAKSCQKPVKLICPYCLTGALYCDPSQYVLACTHCDNQMKAIHCTCGFTIKPSCICKKQETLKRLQENVDSSNYKAIAVGLMLFSMLIWIFSRGTDIFWRMAGSRLSLFADDSKCSRDVFRMLSVGGFILSARSY